MLQKRAGSQVPSAGTWRTQFMVDFTIPADVKLEEWVSRVFMAMRRLCGDCASALEPVTFRRG